MFCLRHRNTKKLSRFSRSQLSLLNRTRWLFCAVQVRRFRQIHLLEVILSVSNRRQCLIESITFRSGCGYLETVIKSQRPTKRKQKIKWEDQIYRIYVHRDVPELFYLRKGDFNFVNQYSIFSLKKGLISHYTPVEACQLRERVAQSEAATRTFPGCSHFSSSLAYFTSKMQILINVHIYPPSSFPCGSSFMIRISF